MIFLGLGITFKTLKFNTFTFSPPILPGIFSFRMIDGEGIFLKESKRNFPNISIISKKLIGINSGYYSDLGEFDSGNVDVLCGANMLVEKSLFIDINGFNEEYFMFGEDIEICLLYTSDAADEL